MKFLKDAWYVAAWSEDVASGNAIKIRIMNEWIAIYRTEGGAIHAIGDRCPHRFASLSRGKVKGETLQCPYHGLQFDGSGKCVHNPHEDGAIPPHAVVKHYPAVERFGAVWVWPGEPSKADPALLPDLEIFDQDEYRVSHGYLHVNASYDLIQDNLLDLSHAAFLHPNLASANSTEKSIVEAKQEGETVWHCRRVSDEPISMLFRQVWDVEADTCSLYVDMRWTAPTHMFLDLGAFPPGKENEDHPRLPSSHLLTPETDHTTHYFWHIGRNRFQQEAAVGEKVHAMISYAFKMEDEPMIREVYENMDGNDFWSLEPVILKGDNAAVRARRILDKKIREEEASPPA